MSIIDIDCTESVALVNFPLCAMLINPDGIFLGCLLFEAIKPTAL